MLLFKIFCTFSHFSYYFTCFVPIKFFIHIVGTFSYLWYLFTFLVLFQILVLFNAFSYFFGLLTLFYTTFFNCFPTTNNFFCVIGTFLLFSAFYIFRALPYSPFGICFLKHFFFFGITINL